MTARTRTCQWCGDVAPTATAHMIHVHEEHPETIGRGRTMSRGWACHDCGTDNGPTAHQCHACGWVHRAIEATNRHRTFVVHYRVAGGGVHQTPPIDYDAAQRTLATLAMLRGYCTDEPAAYDPVRHVVNDTDTGRRLAWLEVAVVTAAKWAPE